jgi:Fur family ferric uptake transcriptional regulator
MNTTTSDKKQRNTRTKEAVVQIFQSFAAPIALNELYTFIKVSLPKTAFSTIFRITRQLEEEGKIIQVDWRERGSRYEWADLPHHHHIVCESCDAVTDIDDSTLRFDIDKVAEDTGYVINSHSIELRGLCAKCRNK